MQTMINKELELDIINVKVVTNILKRYNKKAINELPDGFDKILITISLHCNVSPEDIVSKSRKRSVVYARDFIYCYLRSRGMSLEKIASHFNRNHTTVLHGIETIKGFIKCKDKIITRDYKLIKESLGEIKILKQKI